MFDPAKAFRGCAQGDYVREVPYSTPNRVYSSSETITDLPLDVSILRGGRNGYTVTSMDGGTRFVIRNVVNAFTLSNLIEDLSQRNNNIVIADFTNNAITASEDSFYEGDYGRNMVVAFKPSGAMVRVTYREGLDELASKLARRSKKPLWSVAIDHNGDAVLQRQF